MKKIIAIVFTLSVFIAGCASKSYVKFVDNSIENYIEVTDVKKRTLENGLLEIQIDGVSLTSKYKLFKYRVVWEDKDGFEIKSITSNWQNFSAYKNASFKINAVAPNKNAVEYQLYINK